VQALFWLDDLVRAHLLLFTALAAGMVLLGSWGLLRGYDRRWDQRVTRLVDERLEAFLGNDARQQHMGRQTRRQLQEITNEAQNRLLEYEQRFTEELSGSLRDVVTTARTTGIPIHIHVGTMREADLIRDALGGSVPIQVSRRTTRSTTQEPELAAQRTGDAPSHWDRLLADEEIPCQTNTTETEIPTPPLPVKKVRKKKT
jgi:hypothetical protein